MILPASRQIDLFCRGIDRVDGSEGPPARRRRPQPAQGTRRAAPGAERHARRAAPVADPTHDQRRARALTPTVRRRIARQDRADDAPNSVRRDAGGPRARAPRRARGHPRFPHGLRPNPRRADVPSVGHRLQRAHPHSPANGGARHRGAQCSDLPGVPRHRGTRRPAAEKRHRPRDRSRTLQSAGVDGRHAPPGTGPLASRRHGRREFRDGAISLARNPPRRIREQDSPTRSRTPPSCECWSRLARSLRWWKRSPGTRGRPTIRATAGCDNGSSKLRKDFRRRQRKGRAVSTSRRASLRADPPHQPLR